MNVTSFVSIARSTLAHKTGLEVDPLDKCLLSDRTVNWCETSLDVDFLLKQDRAYSFSRSSVCASLLWAVYLSKCI